MGVDGLLVHLQRHGLALHGDAVEAATGDAAVVTSQEGL